MRVTSVYTYIQYLLHNYVNIHYMTVQSYENKQERHKYMYVWILPKQVHVCLHPTYTCK